MDKAAAGEAALGKHSPEKSSELDFLLCPCCESEVFSLGFCSLNFWEPDILGSFQFQNWGQEACLSGNGDNELTALTLGWTTTALLTIPGLVELLVEHPGTKARPRSSACKQVATPSTTFELLINQLARGRLCPVHSCVDNAPVRWPALLPMALRCNLYHTMGRPKALAVSPSIHLPASGLDQPPQGRLLVCQEGSCSLPLTSTCLG